jgi:hypothetical protein
MKEELTLDTKEILVQLRAAKDAVRNDKWPLAVVTGGIDKLRVKQVRTKSGVKTTIEIHSLDGRAETENYDRAKSRRKQAARRLVETQQHPVR